MRSISRLLIRRRLWLVRLRRRLSGIRIVSRLLIRRRLWLIRLRRRLTGMRSISRLLIRRRLWLVRLRRRLSGIRIVSRLLIRRRLWLIRLRRRLWLVRLQRRLTSVRIVNRLLIRRRLWLVRLRRVTRFRLISRRSALMASRGFSPRLWRGSGRRRCTHGLSDTMTIQQRIVRVEISRARGAGAGEQHIILCGTCRAGAGKQDIVGGDRRTAGAVLHRLFTVIHPFAGEKRRVGFTPHGVGKLLGQTLTSRQRAA